MERREGTIKKLSSEVLKANALLGGAQEKERQLVSKAETRGKIATEQERLLEGRDRSHHLVF